MATNRELTEATQARLEQFISTTAAQIALMEDREQHARLLELRRALSASLERHEQNTARREAARAALPRPVRFIASIVKRVMG